jgi:dipeptide/tripeptide permease
MMATGAQAGGRAGRHGARHRDASRRKLIGVRGVCAAAVWVGLNLATWSGLFEPLPDISFDVWLALAVAATIGVGLLAGRWLAIALAIAPLLTAPAVGYTSQSDAGVAFPFFVAVVATVLIAGGFAGSCVTPARATIVVGSLLLAAPLPLVGWAAERTLWPHDARPAHPLGVALRAGSFQGVALGQLVADAQRSIRGSVGGAPSRVSPLDAPSAPVGVSYLPADAVSVRGRGVSLIAVHGRVVTLFITSPRAQGLAGVGVGDNLGVARARLAGLVCDRSNEGEPTCGARAGHFTILFVGDPIETITLSSIDTGWCLVRVQSCPHPRAVTPLHPR